MNSSIFYVYCFFNEGNETAWRYGGVSVSLKSSLTLVGNSLLSNRTYQFMVYMENRQNSSIQATGYLLVQVDDYHPQIILVA
jgi:hypothetical protein